MSLLTQVISKVRTGRLPAGSPSERAVLVSRQILDKIFGDVPLEWVRFRLWDGSTWPAQHDAPATIVLNRPSALREMFLPGSETGLGEAYLASAFDFEGEIESAFEAADHVMEKTCGWTKKLDLGRLLLELPEAPNAGHARARLPGAAHSPERDRKAIDFHYNVSNDFYALWLGREMAYSCAYFERPNDDLDSAQTAKFELICRKLGLKANEYFLDVGCGWGGLLLHAARIHGVRAKGITLSTEQLKVVREKIHAAGLEDRVSAELLDYRQLPDEPVFDAVASVGMVEHVGRKNLPVYFRKIMSVVKPGGLFLNHGIGVGPVGFPGDSGSFIEDYVFPDTDLLPIGEMTVFAEREGWGVRDIENLRLHYARTLREWGRRLAARREEALNHVSERTYRTWRLYMAACSHNFQTGRLAIYQSLLAKIDPHGASRAPDVRAQWYR